MAAETVRVSASSVCNFSINGSQRRPAIPLSPARFLGLRPRRPHSSSSSEFLGSGRLSSVSSKRSTSQSRGKFSVFAMASDGLSLPLLVLVSITSIVVEVWFFKMIFVCPFIHFFFVNFVKFIGNTFIELLVEFNLCSASFASCLKRIKLNFDLRREISFFFLSFSVLSLMYKFFDEPM